jgi:hypothetical protein
MAMSVDDQTMGDSKEPTQGIVVVAPETIPSLPGAYKNITSNILNLFDWTAVTAKDIAEDDQLGASIELAKGFWVL